MKQGEGGKEGEIIPHLRQPGMPSDATPYLSTPFDGGVAHDKSMLIVSTSGRVTGLANAGSELYVVIVLLTRFASIIPRR